MAGPSDTGINQSEFYLMRNRNPVNPPGLKTSLLSKVLAGMFVMSHLAFAKEEHLTFVSPARELGSRHPFSMNPSGHPASLTAFYLSSRTMFVPGREKPWVCELCEVFPSYENGLISNIEEADQPFNLKINLTIKKNLKWGDGSPLSGKDLYFTWQVAKNIPGKFFGKSMYERIEHIVVDDNDPLNVTLYFRDREYFHADWGQWVILSEHVDKSVWEKYQSQPELYLSRSNYSLNPENQGLWSGPYLPEKNSVKGRERYIRNTYLPGESGTIEKIDWVFDIGQAKNQKVVLVSAGYCELNQSVCDNHKLNYHEMTEENNQYEQITLNLRNPILRDHRVREALYKSIARDPIYQKIYRGGVAPAWQFFPSTNPWFDHNVKFIDEDIDYAKKLLEQSEWLEPRTTDEKNQSAGIRQKQGKSLELTLVTDRSDNRVQVARYLIESWKKIGIDVTLVIQDKKTFTTKTLRRLDFPGLALFAWEIPHDVSLVSLFGSGSVPNIKNRYRGQNLSAWTHHKTDQTLNRLRGEFDFNLRKKYLIELQKNYVEDIPSIPLFFKLTKALKTNNLPNTILPDNSFPMTISSKNWVISRTSLSQSTR